MGNVGGMRKIYLLCCLFLWSCQSNPTDVEEGFNLSITDGYYHTISGTEVRTALSFNYYVQGTECNVGGWAILYDEGSGGVYWYMMQRLIPSQVYSINDTLKHSVSNPVVSMQGYLIGSSDADPRLRAEYYLQEK